MVLRWNAETQWIESASLRQKLVGHQIHSYHLHLMIQTHSFRNLEQDFDVKDCPNHTRVFNRNVTYFARRRMNSLISRLPLVDPERAIWLQ